MSCGAVDPGAQYGVSGHIQHAHILGCGGVAQFVAYPKGPCTQIVYNTWPCSTSTGSTLKPKYIQFGYMDPEGIENKANAPELQAYRVCGFELGSDPKAQGRMRVR